MLALVRTDLTRTHRKRRQMVFRHKK
jgi:hypothetical protein